jgi:hypothetical protein
MLPRAIGPRGLGSKVDLRIGAFRIAGTPMHSPTRLLLALGAAFCFAGLARAADISGKWQSQFDSQVGVQKYVYTFKVEGEKLTGTAEGERSDGKSSVAIEQGKVTKDGIFFVEKLDFQGNDLVIEYTGKMAGDNEIHFTRKVGDFATEEIVAKRVVSK